MLSLKSPKDDIYRHGGDLYDTVILQPNPTHRDQLVKSISSYRKKSNRKHLAKIPELASYLDNNFRTVVLPSYISTGNSAQIIIIINLISRYQKEYEQEREEKRIELLALNPLLLTIRKEEIGNIARYNLIPVEKRLKEYKEDRKETVIDNIYEDIFVTRKMPESFDNDALSESIRDALFNDPLRPAIKRAEKKLETARIDHYMDLLARPGAHNYDQSVIGDILFSK